MLSPVCRTACERHASTQDEALSRGARRYSLTLVTEFRCAGNSIVQPPVNYTSIPFATLVRYWTQVDGATKNGLADVSQCALIRVPPEFMDVQQPLLRQVGGVTRGAMRCLILFRHHHRHNHSSHHTTGSHPHPQQQPPHVSAQVNAVSDGAAHARREPQQDGR